jgi:uncharacterized protein YndB with AHSA1/START domain
MVDRVAQAEIEVAAPASRVWDALTDPAQIETYMFDTHVLTDWEVGHPVVWEGTFGGREYRDHGQVLAVDPGRLLVLSHFSPLTGEPDVPENYHKLTYSLTEHDGSTLLTLSQDNNRTPEAAEHSTAMWQSMLARLKQVVEATPG